MRLRVLLDATRPVRVPLNHHDLLAGLVYRLLGIGDADYARFLHADGYALPGTAADKDVGTAARRFKLFHYSTLRVPRALRNVAGPHLLIRPGRVCWYVGSPQTDFLQHEVAGLLAAGREIHVGSAAFRLAGVEVLPEPQFGTTAAFTCLTPVVAAVPSPDGRPTPYYLRSSDADAFSAAVRKNLLQKHCLIHGAPPADTDLQLAFDPAYTARAAHQGAKKVTIHNTDIIGVQAPLTLTGAPALIRTAWDCGLGEKNSMGFGMLELDTTVRPGAKGVA